MSSSEAKQQDGTSQLPLLSLAEGPGRLPPALPNSETQSTCMHVTSSTLANKSIANDQTNNKSPMYFPWKQLPNEIKLMVAHFWMVYSRMILTIMGVDQYRHPICVSIEYNEAGSVLRRKGNIRVMRMRIVVAFLGSSQVRVGRSHQNRLATPLRRDPQILFEAVYKGNTFQASIMNYGATFGSLDPLNFQQLQEFHYLDVYTINGFTELCKGLSKIKTLRVIRIGQLVVEGALRYFHNCRIYGSSLFYLPELIDELGLAAAPLVASPDNPNWKNIVQFHPNVCRETLCLRHNTNFWQIAEINPELYHCYAQHVLPINSEQIKEAHKLLRNRLYQVRRSLAGRPVHKYDESEMVGYVVSGQRVWHEKILSDESIPLSQRQVLIADAADHEAKIRKAARDFRQMRSGRQASY